MQYTEIIKLIVNKDKKGLEVLFAIYSDKFYGYAIDKWHMKEDDATDIIYQTFESVVLNIASYKIVSEKHFKNFIWKIFKNCLGMRYRQIKALEKHISFVPFTDIYNSSSREEIESDEIEPEPKEIESKEIGTDSRLPILDKERIDSMLSDDDIFSSYNKHSIENPNLVALKNALEKLKKFDQDLLILKAQNYSYDEIAKMLGTENNQLKVKHLRARKRLIKLLTETHQPNETATKQ